MLFFFFGLYFVISVLIFIISFLGGLFPRRVLACSYCVLASILVVYGIKLDNGLDSLDEHSMLTLTWCL